MGINTRLTSTDLAVYGQILLNTIIGPLGLSLRSTLSRLYFLAVASISNIVLVCVNWGSIPHIKDEWSRMNVGFIYVALLIYLLYLR